MKKKKVKLNIYDLEFLGMCVCEGVFPLLTRLTALATVMSLDLAGGPALNPST